MQKFKRVKYVLKGKSMEKTFMRNIKLEGNGEEGGRIKTSLTCL